MCGTGVGDELQRLSGFGAARIVIDSDRHDVLSGRVEIMQCELYQDAMGPSATIIVLDGEPRILVALTGF